jgi:UMF1 family MFS transporter
MFSYGYITELTGSQRGSVLALAILFLAGLFLLMYARRAKTVTA